VAGRAGDFGKTKERDGEDDRELATERPIVAFVSLRGRNSSGKETTPDSAVKGKELHLPYKDISSPDPDVQPAPGHF
jgi:hypothetical protein